MTQSDNREEGGELQPTEEEALTDEEKEKVRQQYDYVEWWKCRDCGYGWFRQDADEQSGDCPKCPSTNVYLKDRVEDDDGE